MSICAWTTYKGNHCKKTSTGSEGKFCLVHCELIKEYSKVKTELCETSKEIKVEPRNKKHLKTIMKQLNNEDDIVQVCLAGGSIEEAHIDNVDYILLDSDNSRFYYRPERGQYRAKNLKVILRSYCENHSTVKVGNVHYCEECYKKLKDVPRISLV